MLKEIDLSKSILELSDQRHLDSYPGFHIWVWFKDSDGIGVPCVKNGDVGHISFYQQYITEPLTMLRVLILAEQWPGIVRIKF